MIQNMPQLRENLWTVVNALQKGLKEAGFDIGKTQSPVTPVYMHGGVIEATHLILDLRENYGIFCSMVIYPVVPKGDILLRLIPTAMHTLEDVRETIAAFTDCRTKLEAGVYNKAEFTDLSTFAL
jgi:glycine C-acetyltransferase